MNLKPVRLRLETEEVRWILQVSLDEDAFVLLGEYRKHITTRTGNER
ncbi:MAG: hypothetical protein WCD88_08310 [Desulfobacterales bacterium]